MLLSRPRRRSILSPALGATLVATVLLAIGCEEEQARLRAETQTVIDTASQDLALATMLPFAPGDDSAEERRRKIQAVVQTLQGADKSEKGQEAALALLAADANRELAAIDLADADAIETEHRRQRALIHSNIDAAMRLDALVAGRADASTASQQASLAEHRNSAEAQLRDYRSQLSQLDGPIADREAQNELDLREASRLEDEANELRRQAAEWGPADGLATFQQALVLEREADQFEFRVANRENDLQFDLRPEYELVGSRVEHRETMLGEITTTVGALRTREDLTANHVQQTRGMIGDFHARIGEALAALSASGGTLSESYDAAERKLDIAVREGRTASRSGQRGDNAGRLALVNTYEKQGQLYVLKHRGLTAHTVVLERLIETDGLLGDPGQLRQALTTTQTEAEDARAKAEEALTNAKEQLEQVQGGRDQTQAQLDAFRHILDVRLAQLTGGDMPDAPADDAPRGGLSRGGARGGGGSGYPSPEALLAIMQSADGADVAATNRVLDAIHAEQPEVKALVDMQRSLSAASAGLTAALTEQFGEDALAEGMGAGPGGMSMPTFDDVRIVSQDDERATVSFTSDQPGAPGGTIDFMVVDGSWKIDGSTLFPGINPAMAQQMQAMTPAIQAMLTDLTTRIRAGEFSSAEEAMQAMMGEMMRTMSGGAGLPGQ
jgi:hypothetical protein